MESLKESELSPLPHASQAESSLAQLQPEQPAPNVISINVHQATCTHSAQ
jgi:hypothetical protein